MRALAVAFLSVLLVCAASVVSAGEKESRPKAERVVEQVMDTRQQVNEIQDIFLEKAVEIMEKVQEERQQVRNEGQDKNRNQQE